MVEAGHERAVCFTCGNAYKALIDEGVTTLGIGPGTMLLPNAWWTQADIARHFPTHFDATSGHLPAQVMERVARAFYKYLGPMDGPLQVPTGSGETVVCLAVAYPDIRFTAVYGLDASTEYNAQAPLNRLVHRLAEVRHA